MSSGVSIRTSFLPVLIAPKIPHGSEPRCDDMVSYTEWASEGLAHHFAVESDEHRLKTNVRGGPLSARCCRRQRANNCDGRRSETLRLSCSPPCFGGQQLPHSCFCWSGAAPLLLGLNLPGLEIKTRL